MLRICSAIAFDAMCIWGDLRALAMTLWTGYKHEYHWSHGKVIRVS